MFTCLLIIKLKEADRYGWKKRAAELDIDRISCQINSSRITAIKWIILFTKSVIIETLMKKKSVQIEKVLKNIYISF